MQYTWDTVFDTANDLMIHHFKNDVKVMTNIKTGNIKVLNGLAIVDSRENITLTEYSDFLMRIAEATDSIVE